MNAKKLLMVMAIMTFALTGCSRSYMNPQHPVRLTSSAFPVAAKDQQIKSYYAVMLSFNDRKWALSELNFAEKTMLARTPKGQTNGEQGIPVFAEVTEEGNVQLHHLYGKNLGRSWANHMKRWVGWVDKSFQKYRQRDLAWLRQELKSRGFAEQ